MIKNKKGQGMTELQLIVIGNVVLLLVLCATVFGVNVKMADNTGFMQRQQAQDVALTINALKAAPQEVEITKEVAQGITLEIKEQPCRVQASVATQEQRSPTEVVCNQAQAIAVRQEQTKLILSKEEGEEIT